MGELLKYEQPTKYIVKKTEYSEEYKIPVLTAGKSFLLGFTDENMGIKVANIKEPVIIFDDFTTGNHYVDFSFKVKSSALKILETNQLFNDVYFLKLVLDNMNFRPENHERHWISIFSEFMVNIPVEAEVKAIQNLFFKIKDQITLHQCKLYC